MSTPARAGAAALVLGPLIGLISMLVQPSVSDDGHDVVTALTLHHGAMIAGLTLQTLSIPVTIAGVVWLAIALHAKAPRLALAGGILGVAGGFVILFEDGLTAATPSVVGALDPAVGAAAVNHVYSSAAAGVDPIALLFDLGIALLAFAAVRAAGVPRWLAVALAVSALAQGVGFGTATRPLVAASFAAMTVLLALLVRSMSTTQTWRSAHQAVAVA